LAAAQVRVSQAAARVQMKTPQRVLEDQAAAAGLHLVQ
jgi:hypothetical protein